MSRRQVLKRRIEICDRCKHGSSECEQVSDRIWPGGGLLCQDCLVLGVVERQKLADIIAAVNDNQ